MKLNRFGSFHSWWVQEGWLKEKFPAGPEVGEKIACLKFILAIGLQCDFETKAVEVSVSDLERLTGLSRPMVIKGARRAENEKIISCSGDYRFTYKLLPDPVGRFPGFAAIPKSYLMKELSQIPNRGVNVFVALKLYIQLVVDRPTTTDEYPMTHKTMIEKLGLQPKQIRPALDILFNHNLIAISTEPVPEGKKRVMNKYKIRGLRA